MYEVGGLEDFLLFRRVWESHWCVLAVDSWCFSNSAAEIGRKQSGYNGSTPSCILEQFFLFEVLSDTWGDFAEKRNAKVFLLELEFIKNLNKTTSLTALDLSFSSRIFIQCFSFLVPHHDRINLLGVCWAKFDHKSLPCHCPHSHTVYDSIRGGLPGMTLSSCLHRCSTVRSKATAMFQV